MFQMIGFVTVVNIRSTLTETGNAGSSTHVANEFFSNDIPWLNIDNILITFTKMFRFLLHILKCGSGIKIIIWIVLLLSTYRFNNKSNDS